MSGLLGDIFSYGDGLKRQLGAFLSDPGGTIDLGVQRFKDQQNTLSNALKDGYPMAGQNSVLVSPQQKAMAQSLLADQGAQQGMAGAIASNALSAPADKAAAMKAMRYEGGWWRGGAPIQDAKKSGDWYTRSEAEAQDYARRTPNADVREYAAPTDTLKHDMGYSPKLAQDLAAQVEGMGAPGASLAAQFRQYDAPISGLEAWRGLSKNLGDDTAMEVLGRMGFKGVQGVNSPDYLRVFPGTPVRDANRAAFDPARRLANDIYGAASPTVLGLLSGGTVAGLAAFHRSRAGE